MKGRSRWEQKDIFLLNTCVSETFTPGQIDLFFHCHHKSSVKPQICMSIMPHAPVSSET